MRLLQLAVASAVAPALALASSCSAPEPVNLLVRGSGGNKTTSMMYGIMHEVHFPRLSVPTSAY